MDGNGLGRDSDSVHVELSSIGKRFQSTQALSDVSLTIVRGSIHALVGENGAGKSTLGKIIAGVISPDQGELRVEGRRVAYRSPREALADGITAIQQEIALVPRRSVLDNVFLGMETDPSPRRGETPPSSGDSSPWKGEAREGAGLGGEHGGRGTRRHGRVDVRAQRRRFDELNASSGFGLDPTVRVGDLSIAKQQKVEIMQALARDCRLIVMDEPTARLSQVEAEQLRAIVQRLRASGVTIVYVSHFLREVLALADAITVLRNGRVVQTTSAATQTPDSLVSAMLGRAAALTFPPRLPPPDDAPVMLSVHDLSRRDAFEGVSFDIRAGEIVGLAGLVGSGRSEVARAMFGADRSDRGTIALDGAPIAIRRPSDAIRAGLAMLPESRKDQGLVMRMPVGHNITLPHLDRLATAGIIDRRRERAGVVDLLRRLAVRPEKPTPLVDRLSGGNQQKVLFAKWLFDRPRALLLDEPTRGVDVGAKRAIYELIVTLAAEGLAVLLISSEIEEVLGLCHRVLVMRHGQIVADLTGQNVAEEPLLRAAFGSAPAHELAS